MRCRQNVHQLVLDRAPVVLAGTNHTVAVVSKRSATIALPKLASILHILPHGPAIGAGRTTLTVMQTARASCLA